MTKYDINPNDLEVVKYLKVHSIEDLKRDHGIFVSDYEHFWIFNYNQICVDKKFDPIVRECRGLVIDKHDFSVLCRSFDRFFNIHEEDGIEYEIDETSLVYDKLDGTLINVWWNPHDLRWESSTRKTLGELGINIGQSFRDMVERALGCSVDEKFKEVSKFHTYSFELTSPDNRILTPYLDYQLRLIGVRDNSDGYCYGYDLDKWGSVLNVGVVGAVAGFNALNEVKTQAASLDVTDEGYVVYWKGGKRLKVKNPKYVELSKKSFVKYRVINNGKLSFKGILQTISSGELDEYLSYFPEDKQIFVEAQEIYKYTIDSLQQEFDKYSHIEDRKEFAIEIKDLTTAPILFSMKSGNSVVDSFERLLESRKIDYLETYADKRREDLGKNGN